MNIELEVVTADNGGVVVLVDRKTFDDTVARLRTEAEASKDPTMRESALATVASLVESDKQIRSFTDRLEIRTYPFRPYTWGEKIEAQAAATTWVGDSRQVDNARFETILLSNCLGKSEEDVRAMEAPVVRRLITLMFERCEPSQERLTFFSGGPTSSQPSPGS